jgi:rhodanese-related sulfurtransferase
MKTKCDRQRAYSNAAWIGGLCGALLAIATPRCLDWDDLKQSEFEILTAGYAKMYAVAELQAPELVAQNLSDPELLLVDVRSAEEQSVSRLPGAALLSPDANPGDHPAIQEFLLRHSDNANARVVFYCAAGYRSARSMARMPRADRATNGPRLLNLHGGIIAYAGAGGALVTPQGQPTRKVHTYNEKWSVHLPPPFEAVVEPKPLDRN